MDEQLLRGLVGQRLQTKGRQGSFTTPQPLPPFNSLQTRDEIKQRLREWETEHAANFIPAEQDESPKVGEVYNMITRLADGPFRADHDEDRMDDGFNEAIFDPSELLDVGDRRDYLSPGDLVELRSQGGQQQELAIYVRAFETQSQFYTMSGRWLHRKSVGALFSVHHFVQPLELDELLPYLPQSDVDESLQDVSHSLPQLVPRNIGQPLLIKMLEFWNQSDAAYQTVSLTLDNAYGHLAKPNVFRYCKLEVIANILLSETALKTEDGEFPDPVLYAVHRSLLRGTLGIRAQPRGTLRAGGQYEISSEGEVSTIELVQRDVRAYTERLMAGQQPPHILPGFFSRARILIDRGRKKRHFTSHGTIGPLTKSTDDDHVPLSMKNFFSKRDKKIIRFLESWAAMRTITPYSPLHATGSTILRGIDRYGEAQLDQKIAWTFLQEIGAIPPWQSRPAYDMRLPGTGVQPRRYRANVTDGFVADKMANLRQDWGSLPVYCIDDAAAHEIDDGLSIEPTDTPDQYWVHIHTADPGAHIEPKGTVARFAREMIGSVYMPERVVNMLMSSFVQTNLSLAPGRPSLTFSAKMDINGDLLEYKATPGIIHNVQNITPQVTRDIILGPVSDTKETVRVVGSPVPPKPVSRHMLSSDEISDVDKENLRLLHVIGKARQEKRKAKGGIATGRVNMGVSVSFGDVTPNGCMRGCTPLSYDSDPTIQVTTEEIDLELNGLTRRKEFNFVEPIMLLAGEVAARWCNDRGIPIVYRVTPKRPDSDKLADFYHQNVLPTKDENGDFDVAQVYAYLRMLGGVQVSTTPGPHAPLGVDMIVKCTSPLRRYPDLLLQWQVEAAILEEARLGHSLIGNTKENFLPFTKDQIDGFLPRIDTRERIINWGQRRSVRHWLCQFLVRAWRFGEADIPRTSAFKVTSVNTKTNRATGVWAAFSTAVDCVFPESTNITDVKRGDTFEVELFDINIYKLGIDVKAIRRLESSENDKP